MAPPSPKASPSSDADEAENAAKALPGPLYVVKSQIHAGGRGKGKFKPNSVANAKGGVRLDQIGRGRRSPMPSEMLGNTLVTKQTGPAGKQVNRLYIEDGANIARELYLSILVDRTNGKVQLSSPRPRAAWTSKRWPSKTPEKIHTVGIDPITGVTGVDIDKLNAAFELTGAAAEDGKLLFPALYKAFTEKDMSLLEVNPLIVMTDGHLRVLDAKVSFDNNALFRHPDVMELRDATEEDDKEIEASKWDLAYIALDGTIGCMVNGAGLAMATMDIIKLYGAEPGQLPRCRRRRVQGKSDGRLQDHHMPTRASKAYWSTSSAASCGATSSPRASSPRSRRSGSKCRSSSGSKAPVSRKARRSSPNPASTSFPADDLDDAAQKIVKAVGISVS